MCVLEDKYSFRDVTRCEAHEILINKNTTFLVGDLGVDNNNNNILWSQFVKYSNMKSVDVVETNLYAPDLDSMETVWKFKFKELDANKSIYLLRSLELLDRLVSHTPLNICNCLKNGLANIIVCDSKGTFKVASVDIKVPRGNNTFRMREVY